VHPYETERDHCPRAWQNLQLGDGNLVGCKGRSLKGIPGFMKNFNENARIEKSKKGIASGKTLVRKERACSGTPK